MHANLTTEETYRQADIRQRETMKELVADLPSCQEGAPSAQWLIDRARECNKLWFGDFVEYADLIQFCIARMGQEPPSGDEIFPFEDD